MSEAETLQAMFGDCSAGTWAEYTGRAPSAAEINQALWEHARIYHRAGIHSDLLFSWQCAFRCWFARKLELTFNPRPEFKRMTP